MPDVWRSVSAACEQPHLLSAWRLNRSSAWIIACHHASRRPQQGWKLHLSAGLRSAMDVLDKALPVILDEDADFKVVASLRQLGALNEGGAGLSQVGKFLTVYPNDDAQAVRLAAALSEATQELSGPRIPSDRPLRARGVVYYRYGGFGDLQVRTPPGEQLPAIRAPDGRLVPDRRGTGYDAPPWVTDPFVAAGVATGPPPPSRRIGDRYLILAQLHASPRSQVHLCMDLAGPRSCVVKRVADDGSGSMERLRNEHTVLTRLAPNPSFPRPIELFDADGELCLAMEDVAGHTLGTELSNHRERNILPAASRLLHLAADLADMLAAIHAKGLVYGDLKSTNVIVTTDGELRLVDFELACGIGGRLPSTFGNGTPGYMAPQQVTGRPATVGDDVYGFGALLYLIATGAEPSFAPDPSALLDRSVELLNPALGPALATVIGRCLDADPDRRPVSPGAAAAAIADAARPGVPVPVARPASAPDPLILARRIGDMLCGSVSERGFTWTHGGQFDGQPSLELNTGAAGAILALAELAEEFGGSSYRTALARGAGWLARQPRPGDVRLPGLYVGEAGIGTALMRAGQVLGDGEFTHAAVEIGRWVASVRHSSPDLFNGTAGRLRFHLWLWMETADQEHLDHALAAASRLLATGGDRTDGLSWTIPPGYDRLSGRALTGYAHGAAGIADALLDLFEVTGDGELLSAAQSVSRWLEGLAQSALESGAGVNWPPQEGGLPVMAFWCHGAAGITRFLLHLHRLTERPQALELARRAALVVAEGTRWSGVTQCHGLAGNIECLLDMYQATGEDGYLRDATVMTRLVHAFAGEHGAFTLRTDRNGSSPGFSTGCAGVATCLLRLARPRTRPHLLSLRGLCRDDRVRTANPAPAAGCRPAGHAL